jgi:uncharacterized protein
VIRRRIIGIALAFSSVLAPSLHAADPVQLDNAIVADNVAAVREAVVLDGYSVDARIPVPGYPDGAPLIAIAARAASLKVLRYLIEAGANLEARTPVHETALMLACFWKEEPRDGEPRSARLAEKHDRAARMLIEAGASPENVPGAYTALSYAAYEGRDALVRLLIERGARVNGDAVNGTAEVNTPLMMAAITGQLDAVMQLLRAGADARIRKSSDGSTALEFARKYNQKRLLRPLGCAQDLAPGEPFAGKCAN